jgi:hypothetical protein
MPKFEQVVEAGETPWGLRWSLIAGFVAWGTDLGFSYILEQHSCSTGHHYVLHVISVVCFVVALSGFLTGVADFKQLPRNQVAEEGGRPLDRAYFQALLGMVFSLSFALVIIAGAVPRWILSPCE